MHFTTKQTVSVDKEGGVILPEHIFNEVQLISCVRICVCVTTSVKLSSCLFVVAAVSRSFFHSGFNSRPGRYRAGLHKLINDKTGKTLLSLISGDRLKEYRVDDRIDLDKRLPGAKPREALLSPSLVDKSNDWESARRILRERTVNKKKDWLVLFVDKSQWWCSDVTPALLKEFRILQARIRNRR